MEEKIELNIFLNKLVSAVTKKFEKLEVDMEMLKTELEKFKQTGQKDNLKEFEEKLRNMEFSINSLKNKSQIDKSILKLIETEEQERKSEQYGR
jgi:TolA-binding protein